jgi:hypothetical protein
LQKISNVVWRALETGRKVSLVCPLWPQGKILLRNELYIFRLLTFILFILQCQKALTHYHEPTNRCSFFLFVHAWWRSSKYQLYDLTPDRSSNLWITALEASMLTIIPPLRFVVYDMTPLEMIVQIWPLQRVMGHDMTWYGMTVIGNH